MRDGEGSDRRSRERRRGDHCRSRHELPDAPVRSTAAAEEADPRDARGRAAGGSHRMSSTYALRQPTTDIDGTSMPAAREHAPTGAATNHARPHEHAQKAAAFVANDARLHWHDQAIWFLRGKRDRVSSAVPDWEQLRSAAEQIKAHTLSQIAEYLEQFERKAIQLGAQVHWARDADEHNRTVHSLLA